MEKYRIKGTVTTIRNTELHKIGATGTNRNVVKKIDLPPLSMESYVFTGKGLQKKQKQVRSTIHEAESLMALELGRPPRKKKNRVFWENTR